MEKSKDAAGVCVNVDCFPDGRRISKPRWVTKGGNASYAEEVDSKETTKKRLKHKPRFLSKRPPGFEDRRKGPPVRPPSTRW